jgi:hypothetical protein
VVPRFVASHPTAAASGDRFGSCAWATVQAELYSSSRSRAILVARWLLNGYLVGMISILRRRKAASNPGRFMMCWRMIVSPLQGEHSMAGRIRIQVLATADRWRLLQPFEGLTSQPRAGACGPETRRARIAGSGS